MAPVTSTELAEEFDNWNSVEWSRGVQHELSSAGHTLVKTSVALDRIAISLNDSLILHAIARSHGGVHGGIRHGFSGSMRLVDTSQRRGHIPAIEDSRREMYRQQILAAAELEFSRAGFDAARVADIARTADVSTATLYKFFAGKDDLWNDLIMLRMAEAVDVVRRVEESDEVSPFERLMLIVEAQVHFFAAHPNFLQIHIEEGLSWATGGDGAGAGRGMQRVTWGAGIELVTHGVESAVAAGEMRPISTPLIARLMVSALQVWLTDWATSGCVRPPNEVAAELVAHLRTSLRSSDRSTHEHG